MQSKTSYLFYPIRQEWDIRLTCMKKNQILWLEFFVRIYTVINPFHATGLFRYPLKTSENQSFSDVFRGYRKRPVAWNGLNVGNISKPSFDENHFTPTDGPSLTLEFYINISQFKANDPVT